MMLCKMDNEPILMSDGRLFTDYRPRCDIHMEYQAPMSGNHEYRNWLIHNGQELMNQKRNDFVKTSKCTSGYDSTLEKDTFVCDKIACTKVLGANCGIGTGRR